MMDDGQPLIVHRCTLQQLPEEIMAQTTTRDISLPRATRRKRWLTRDRLTAMLMIAPSVIAIAVFVYGFIGWTGYVSMSAWDTIKPDYTFIGFKNYLTIFNNGRFQTNIRNLIVFTAFFLILCLAFGLLLAVLIDSRIRGEAFFRSVYIFPMAISFIVTGVAWRWVFTPGSPADPTGINLLLERFGLGFLQSDWIADKRVVPGWYPDWSKTKLGIPLAMIPVVIAALWQMSGFTMAMYLAGLRGISDEIKEAARVDGCGEWQVFRYITLPLLQPVTLSAVIILAHISLKIFDLVVSMTNGGPGNATEVPGLLMYALTFSSNKFAEGAAVGMVMLVLISFLIVPYLNYSRSTEVDQ
jgi:glucose/mannose transport system permease protein